MCAYNFLKIISLEDLSSKEPEIEQIYKKNKHVWQPKSFFQQKYSLLFLTAFFFLFMSNEILRSPMSLEPNPLLPNLIPILKICFCNTASNELTLNR